MTNAIDIGDCDCMTLQIQLAVRYTCTHLCMSIDTQYIETRKFCHLSQVRTGNLRYSNRWYRTNMHVYLCMYVCSLVSCVVYTCIHSYITSYKYVPHICLCGPIIGERQEILFPFKFVHRNKWGFTDGSHHGTKSFCAGAPG